jgi:Tfp pilus assembly protein PilF/GTP-binding protein EngB required for normal cell division
MGIFDRLGQRLSDLVDDLAGPEHLRESFARGGAALDRGAFAEAEQELARVVAEDASSARAWHLLGLSQQRQGKLAEAIVSLERAATLRPESFSILATLAEAQRLGGQLEGAQRSYKAALQCRADERLLAGVFAGLGELYLARGETERAVRELRKAVALARQEELPLIGRLGVAQYRSGDFTLARASLERAATAVPLDREVGLLLAQVLLDLGEPESARLAATRLLQEDARSAPARCARARAHLALGDASQARDELLHALELDPRSPEIHALLARVHRQIQDLGGAERHLRAALAASGGDEQAASLLRELCELGIEADPVPAALGADAEKLLALEPNDPLGLAARALALLPEGAEEAERLLARSLAGGERSSSRIVQGLCYLGAGRPSQAASALRSALRLDPSSARARALCARAYTALAGLSEEPGGDLYPLIRRSHTLLLSHPALSALGLEAARIQEVFDRPLLVAVMGEFSTGKSTFVNALIGEPVAPMGVTPTTATINLLKYGEQRAARVLWADDREELLSWEALEGFLSGLEPARARRVRLVEILYPSEELLRVNVVDTPGLNSLHEEHEATARAYMAQADAVVWLFSAHQAGKQTEEQALELLRQHKLKTVGVLNKIDRLTEEELGAVEQHLAKSFAGLLDAVVPVSALRALEAMREGGAAKLEASRFPELRRFLEERLFARSRDIKREAAGRRLLQLLGQAERSVLALVERLDDATTAIEELTRGLAASFPPEQMTRERATLEGALHAVYRRGATEVLDFVRPRRWALGEHRATDADRDFLLELLAGGLEGLCDASYGRVEQQLRAAVRVLGERLPAAAGQTGLPLAALCEERLGLLREQVYTRYTAFARGYLLGGRVDDFFTRRLPHLDLALEPVQEALLAGRVDLERELLAPLERWYRELTALLRRALEEQRQEILLERMELDLRLLAPVLAISRAVTSERAAP